MIKVLFLTNVPAPYRVDFFQELGKKCDLTVLYDIDDREIQDRDPRWFSESNKNHKSVILKKSKWFKNKISFEIIKYLKNYRYDCIVIGIYSLPTAMLAIEYMKLKNIPFVLNSDGGFVKKDSKLIYYLKKRYIGAAAIYASSSKETDKYFKYYGAKETNIYRYPMTSIKEKDILTNIIEDEEKVIIKEKLGIKEKTVLLSVGQFIYRKGNDVLIDAFSKIRDTDVGLYIVGGKPTIEYIELVEKLCVKNIYFLDFMNKEDLKRYYLAADLFVLPTREDIWGLVINEAMACGLPIVTTNKCNSGLELIQNSKNGYLVEVDNSNELYSKIKEILEKESLNDMKLNSLMNIKKYSIEESASIYFDIIKLIKLGDFKWKSKVGD